MKRKPSILGKSFGQLKVIEYLGSDNYLCECACGVVKSIKGYNLITHGYKIRSCGCQQYTKLRDKFKVPWRSYKKQERISRELIEKETARFLAEGNSIKKEESNYKEGPNKIRSPGVIPLLYHNKLNL